MNATRCRAAIPRRRGALVRALVASLLLGGSAAHAQSFVSGTEHLAFDRPEAWALKYFASATLLGGLEPPGEVHPGEVHLGLEVGTLPHLSARERTVGFNGTKTENLNKLPLIARPRLTVGLPWQLSLSAAYVPPLKVNGARANLFAVSVGKPVLTTGSLRLAVRAYGQLGSVSGDFTCPAEAVAAGADPVNNPYGCTEPSSDRSTLRYLGLEVGGAYRIERWHGLEPHAAIALNAMGLAFDVNARYQGIVDTTRLVASGATVSSSVGLGIPIGSAWRIDADAFYSPLSIHRPGEPTRIDGLLNARLLVRYRVR